jgi:hypothetical protein
MLYMFLATTSAAGLAGMSVMNALPGSSGSTMLTLDHPTLAFVVALVLIGYGLWDLDRLSAGRYRLAAAGVSLAGMGAADGEARKARELLLSPAINVGCRVAMGAVMAFSMLIAI